MLWLIVFIVIVGGILCYVLRLDFELGSGFSEMRDNMRQAKYTVVKRDNTKEQASKTLPENSET